MPKIIIGCTEVLEQVSNMLMQIDNATYTKIPSSYSTSSIGEHIRHILDHFIAIEKGITMHLIDYDIRRRGAPYEGDINEAISQIERIANWLRLLSSEALTKAIDVKTEVTFSETNSIIVKSSVSRELAFVQSHTVHHLFTISMLFKMDEITVEKEFGFAPATISYLKSKHTKCVQ